MGKKISDIIETEINKQEQEESQPILANRSEDKEILLEVGKGLDENFIIRPDQENFYLDLFDYFRGNQGRLDLNKGLLICGGVGTGKTFSMKLFQRISRTFGIVTTRHIIRDYHNDKAPGTIIDKYGRESFLRSAGGSLDKSKPHIWCFDDFGLEAVSVKNYGNEVNPLEEIMLDRYDLALSCGMKTFITTNLNADMIEKNYGVRVRDRFRETMNFINMNGQTFRK